MNKHIHFTNRITSILAILALTVFILMPGKGWGQISITSNGTAFTQNFDGIGSSGTAPLPSGWKIDQGTNYATGTTASTLAYGTTGTGAVTSTSGGGAINWANGITANSTDRAIGFLCSSGYTSPRNLFLQVTNNTGSIISSLSITYDIEKYRSGTRIWDINFYSSTDGSNWAAQTSGNQNYTADAANTTVYNPPTTISKTVTINGLTLANGASFYLRWAYVGNGGSTNAQGLGIDNFSITSTGSTSSNDATLSALTTTAGTLTPLFASATTSYNASVSNATTSVTVTPTSNESHATIQIQVNGAGYSTVTSGNASADLNLNVGTNTIDVKVTAQDGTTIKTYTITVNRASLLPLLGISGTLNQGIVCPNTSASPNQFTITNTGGAQADGIEVNSNNSEFAISGLSSTSIAPGASVTFNLIFTPTSAGSKTATITVTSTTSGSNSPTISPTGTGTTPVSPSITTNSATLVVNTTATLNGTLTTLGVCPATTEKGFVYSLTSINNNPVVGGSGVTKIAVSGLTTGAYTQALTSLTATSGYSYKAYVYDGSNYTYGSVQTFTTLSPATKLVFGTAPPATGVVGTNLAAFTVQAQRADNTVDAEFSGTVTLVKISGSGAITGTTASPISGIATFSNTKFDAADTYFIKATAVNLFETPTSDQIVISIANSSINAWINTSNTTAWCTGSNWNSTSPPTSSEVAQWNNTGNATGSGITFSSCVPSILGIEVTSSRTRNLDIGSSSSTSGTLTLTGGIINLTPNVIVRNASAYTLTLKANYSSSGPMAIGISNATNSVILNDGNGDITISAVISGTGPLVKAGSGSGVLYLGASNTYTRGTVINSGMISVNGSGRLGDAAGSLTINNGTFQLTTASIGTGTRSIILGHANSTIDIASGISYTSTTGVISGSGNLNKTSAGTLELQAQNTYTGTTVVTGGTLKLNRSGGTTIPVTNSVSINGGTLQVSSNQTINNLTLSSGNLTVDAGVTLTINGTYSKTGGTITNNGTVIIAGETAPGISAITPGNQQLSVAFTAGNAAGTTITNYKYSTDNGATFIARSPASTTSPIVITGLTNGTPYNVQIKAVNEFGDRTATASSQGTPATTPVAPTINSITPGCSSLSVAFTAGSDGGSPITNYKYSTDGGTSFTAVSPAQTTSPIIINGLNSGTTYNVKLLAVNNIGDGTSSGTTQGTTNPRPTSNVSGGGAICNGGTLPDVSIALTGTGPWDFTYFNGTSSTLVTGNSANPFVISAAPAGIYTVTALVDALCTAQASDMSGSATVTITPVSAAPTGSVSQSFCGSGTVANLAATGNDIKWYDAATNGNLLPTNTALVNGTHYYASQTEDGKCESTDRLEVIVTITSEVTPTFDAVGPYCADASIDALPTTSKNGITGTWSPAISNTATTEYTFTPTVGQCATTAKLTITINSNTTPTFDAVGPYCSGSSISALPTTSTNGITGTWSPAINNAATTEYTFTPTAGQCATTATLTITINAAPTADAGPDYFITLTGVPYTFPDASASGGTISWSSSITSGAGGTFNPVLPATGEIHPEFTPSGTGVTKITLTVTGSCSTVSNDITIYVMGTDPIEWNGGQSTSWSDPNNWSQFIVPDATTNVLIKAGATHYPTLTANAYCKDIVIESGASLIDMGNYLHVSGKATFNHPAVSAGQWHFISSPVVGAVSGMFTDQYLRSYDPVNGYKEVTALDVTLNKMEGYALWPVTNPNAAPYVSTTGTGFNSGTISRPLSDQGSTWNLVGNPYPSTIDWDAASGWTKANIGGAIYIEDGGNWSTYVHQAGTNTGSRYIAATQGFFINATGAGATLGMTPGVQVHMAKTPMKNSEEAVPNLVRLEVSGNGYKDEAVVRFVPEATSEFDNDWDAYKFFGKVPESAQLYTLGSSALSINSLPAVDIVPVGIHVGKAASYTIAATEMNDLENVTLEDVQTGIFTDLSAGSYTFDASTGDFNNRFKLHFSMLSVEETSKATATIYSYQKTIYINIKDQQKGDIFVYNISGQLVKTIPSARGINEIKVPVGGNYIVKVVGGDNTSVKKVWIQQ